MSATFDHGFPIGSVFENRYELAERLGGGTFGLVYRARQLSTGRTVALKMVALRHEGTARDHRVDRLRREMRLCSELFHPNIVRLIDSGDTEDGTVYAAFDYVPGTTLKEVLATEGKLSLRETAHLLGQVLDALSCAHARGVVHRDLKPENIMVTRTGTRRNAMVLDFGLGGFAPEAEGWGLPRITATQEMMGTPCYAAPEQLRGEPPTTRSDLYSWGLIFIECLTGELAVRGASVHEAILKQLNDEPIALPADLPSERLRALLETVTAKVVEKRDVAIGALLDALSVLGAEAPVADASGVEPQRSGGERRQVTVLSCRLSVTRLDRGRVDLEDLDELLHSQRAVYSELAERRGGHIASAVGDRAILVFGYPQAREDDARQAARTALSIVGEVHHRSAQLEAQHGIALQVRIGLHTGLVIAHEQRRLDRSDPIDLVGPTPQIAIRLEQMAREGEVLASLDTQRLLRREVDREPAGHCPVPEIGDNVPVFRLTRVRQASAGIETIQSEAETRLVGRTKQLAQLLEMWEHAQAGRPAIVLMIGEPGIGKSRLVRELSRHVPADAWLALQCAAENQNSPLRPIVDLLSVRLEPLETLLARYAMNPAEHLPLLAQLLSLPADERYPLRPLTPERMKEETLNALLTLLSRMAAARPLVLTVEDLHWADPTTLELLQRLVEELRTPDVADSGETPRLCVVMTARPEFTPTWSIENVLLLPLPHLASAEVEEMVKSSVGADLSNLPREVIAEVVSRSDGIPLFVEEVTRMLVESGGEQASRGGDIAIPGSLRDLITARLDGVSASAKETAQVASLLGREFRYEFLRAISPKPEAAVRSDVRELMNAGLLYRRRNARSESYLFKHVLLRDIVYESMRRAARQQLHERAANTLRERFPEIERTQPETLALHFELGGQRDSALACWRRAGDLAVSRGAYVESIRHFQAGLDIVASLGSSRASRESELALRTSLGISLIATKGYGAQDVEQNYSRAQALCLDLGDAPQLIPALYGLWTYHLLRDHGDTPLELAARLAQIARAPEHILIANATRGITALWMADFSTATAYLDKAIALYDIAHQRSLACTLGEDAALLAPLYRMWCLFHQGKFDQALAHQRRMEALVAEVGSPYVTTTSMIFAMHLWQLLEDVAMTRYFAEKALALSVEQRFPFFVGTATCGLGWTLVAGGEVAAGIAQLREGIAVLDLTGAGVAHPHWMACIAEGQLQQGDVAAGLATVEAAFALVANNLNRLVDSWLHRVKGELLLRSADPGGGEQALRAALDIAHRHAHKPLELRAAMSLARLLRNQGKTDAARPLLGEVFQSFDEGFDSKDLRGARELLDELS